MPESKMEPEAQPSTSQSVENSNATILPLVSMPKVVLERIDLAKLPLPVSVSNSSAKKPVKRLLEKKNKPLHAKTAPQNTSSTKHDTRFRGKPKKDYKLLSEFGKFSTELPKTKNSGLKTGGITKKVPRLLSRVADKEEDNTVRGMLKKTMLQKRSKIVIPPVKKPKLSSPKTNAVSEKSKKEKKKVAQSPKKEISPKTKEISFQDTSLDMDDSEDEFLYDELIDELVNPPHKKNSTSEKTTNITLKPKVGNKPPTIVKGGIVKKSSLPPDLKLVASPPTLNSSKSAGTALTFKSKPTTIESTLKTPATAETPKASLPSKASPFPIAINSSSKAESKGQGKKGPKKPDKPETVVKEDSPSSLLNTPTISNSQTKISPKEKSPISRPRGRPRLGPKKVAKDVPILNTAAEDESDEYTEVETLENIDTDPVDTISNNISDSEKNGEIQVLTQITTKSTVMSDVDRSEINSKKDEDPHLDLLRILSDDTEDAAQSDSKDLEQGHVEKLHKDSKENPTTEITKSDIPVCNSEVLENTEHISNENPNDREGKNSSCPQPQDASNTKPSQETSSNAEELKELPSEIVVEEPPPVRTIYDLMSEVSLQYPSWNLHIIPETNAFCIAQVTKGRLGLPTLKKCIELDPDTYSAKVYIHQYHIKRFDGVYDSEEAILALIEEIHSIKA